MPSSRNHRRLPHRHSLVSADSAHNEVAFMHLPTELLDLICREVDLDGLLALCSLCNRLHCIALPIFFDRTGFNGSSVTVRDRSIENVFVKISKAIRLSFTAMKLDHLDCMLNVQERGVVQKMKDLRELFNKLTLVSCVDLRFIGAPKGTTFPSVFFALLNSLENTKCVRLHIQPPTLRHYSAGIGSKKDWKPVHTCTEIHISMNVTVSLCEAFMKWLVLSINSSPIQIFKFSSTQNRDEARLPFLLDRVDLPHLTELHISTVVRPDDFDRILSKHSIIQLLCVTLPYRPSMYDRYSSHRQESYPYNLPHLTRLAAPPSVIGYILAQGKTPTLHAIHIQTAFRPAQYSLMQCLVAICLSPTVRRLSLCNCVVQYMRLGNGPDESFLPHQVSYHITHLTLFMARFDMRIQLLLRWISALFPSLETLVLHEFVTNGRSYVRKQLKEICPTVELSFDDDESTQPVAQWLGKAVI